MSIYLNKDNSFLDSPYFHGLSNEEKLELYDNMIIQISESLDSAERDVYSKMSYETKNDLMQELKVIQGRRKLLFERMGVSGGVSINNPLSHSKEKDEKNVNNQTFINSQVHYGEGAIIKDTKKIFTSDRKHWYEKSLGIIILTVIVGLIIGGILYYLKWN
ncbi:MAG: hypothetical protein AABY22_31470 [Nanoarchaeota archaeon]